MNLKMQNLKWEISLSPDGKQWKEVLLKTEKTGHKISGKLEALFSQNLKDGFLPQ